MRVSSRVFGFVGALSMCVSSALAEPTSADMSLVITTNLKEMNCEKSFYRTILMQGDAVHSQYGALTLSDLSPRFLRTKDTLFIGEGAMSKSVVLQGGQPIAQGEINVLAGPHVLTLHMPVWSAAKPSDIVRSMAGDPLLARELSARQRQVAFAVYQVGEQKVVALNLRSNVSGIAWPTRSEDLFYTPAAVGAYAQEESSKLFVATRSHTLGLALGGVDRALASKSIPTVHLDTGGALSAEDLSKATGLQSMLLERNSILVAGPQDLQAFGQQPSLLAKQSYLVPSSAASLQSSKVVQVGTKRVQISRIGALSDDAAVFLQQDKGMTLLESLKQAHTSLAQNKPDVAIAVLLHAADLEKHAALLTAFDALIVPINIQGTMPAEHEIVLRAQNGQGQRPFPPIIEVTHDDITQLYVWTNQKGEPSRLHVVRHDLIEGATQWALAPDAHLFESSNRQRSQAQAALPARGQLEDDSTVWTSQELDHVLAGILQSQLPKTDLVITEKSHMPLTSIIGEIPRGAAEVLLHREGSVAVVKVEGDALKKVFKMISKGQFANLLVWGANVGDPTIQKAALYKNQTYHVAMTQKTFLQIRHFLQQERLLGTSDLQAERVGDFAAGTKGNLKTLGKVKLKNVKAPIALREGSDVLLTSPRVERLMAVGLGKGLSVQSTQDLLQSADGKPRHAMVLHITDLDVGGSVRTNSLGAAKTWRDDGSGQYGAINDGFKQGFELHLLVNSGLRLGYEGPAIETAVAGKFKFFHVSRTEEPIDDSLVAHYEIRVPIERMIENPKTWTFSPLFFAEYETSVFPNKALKFLTDEEEGSENWNKWVQNRKNTHKMRFFLGAAVHPLDDDGYSNMFRIGPVARLAISQLPNHKDAWNPGIEATFEDSWTWHPVKLKLETTLTGFIPFENPSNMAKDKEALEWVLKGKLLFALIGNLSIGILGDSITGFTMKEPDKWGAVLRGGLALSYNHRFKWDV
ncbi:MAG: hypothetical protein AAF320_03730 [Myxococcota bacterium]